VLAAALQTLPEAPYAFHGRLLHRLEAVRLVRVRDARPLRREPLRDNRQVEMRERLPAPIGPKTIFSSIRRLCEAVLHRPVHPHMLRHSVASRLRENGTDLQDIQEALGHAVITTTTMYAHLTTRRQREQLAEYLK
jgi:integrase